MEYEFGELVPSRTQIGPSRRHAGIDRDTKALGARGGVCGVRRRRLLRDDEYRCSAGSIGRGQQPGGREGRDPRHQGGGRRHQHAPARRRPCPARRRHAHAPAARLSPAPSRSQDTADAGGVPAGHADSGKGRQHRRDVPLVADRCRSSSAAPGTRRRGDPAPTGVRALGDGVTNRPRRARRKDRLVATDELDLPRIAL